MPTRYLKPGIRDSELIDAVSPMAETLFYRLIVTVDDFGRADARPAMVKASCYPIKANVTAEQCDALLAELAAVRLIDVYTVEGKPYLQLRKWDNAPRAKASKFPAPADGCMHVYASANDHQSTTPHTCAQVHADASNPRTVLPVTVTVTETETGTDNREPKPGEVRASKRGTRLPSDWVLPEEWLQWAEAERPDLNVYDVAKNFADYWHAKTGADATKMDWLATWRMWVRKEKAQAAAGRGMPESFRERDERLARERVQRLIGGAAPSMHDVGDVIDVGPDLPRIEQ